jgi:hypothetical protein
LIGWGGGLSFVALLFLLFCTRRRIQADCAGLHV